jgi:AcrR family transcriptional regulator
MKSVILKAATPLFARFGFKKTSVDEIARAAHVSKATLYHHFKSKDEVFAAVMRHEADIMMQSIERAVDEAKQPKDKLRAFLRTHGEVTREALNLYQVSGEVLRELIPLAHKVTCEAESRGFELLHQIICSGVADGSFYISAAKAELLTKALHTGLQSHDFVLPEERNNPNYDEQSSVLIDLLLRGLTHPKDGE